MVIIAMGDGFTTAGTHFLIGTFSSSRVDEDVIASGGAIAYSEMALVRCKVLSCLAEFARTFCERDKE
ncbi:hypothetical protein KQX54_018509 [Cotesia glomerata]|uniref:Uncharacterized protein n=1 Tax=Cotesia glomerata TaxID=32391 RepID=A0AAV7HWH3_COTGL|nr:hypothetical protein KQX54_018509 [Cotesia glomerata]